MALRGNQPIDVFLGEGALERDGLIVWAPLEEDLDDGHNAIPANGAVANNVPHLVPGPIVAVGPAGGNVDEEVALHEPLQRLEQDDLAAVQRVLGIIIPNSTITGRHLWRVLDKLSTILPESGPYRIPFFQAEFAKILQRTARVITYLSKENYDAAHGQHPLEYEDLILALQDTLPGCPIEFGECLRNLCLHLNAYASVMPVADGVFIFKDLEEFADTLRSLAIRILRA